MVKAHLTGIYICHTINILSFRWWNIQRSKPPSFRPRSKILSGYSFSLILFSVQKSDINFLLLFQCKLIFNLTAYHLQTVSKGNLQCHRHYRLYWKEKKNGQQSTADRFQSTISTLSYSAIGINSSSFAEWITRSALILLLTP